MPTLAQLEPVRVTVGVDTHKDAHVAVAKDHLGRHLGDNTVSTTPRGYRDLLAWAESHGEVEAWGHPTFRAGKKMFAMFVHHDGYGFALAFKPDATERPALVLDPRFYVPPYLGPSGWLALDLTVAPVDWTEVAELLDASYRQVALKRMLKDLATREHA